MVDQRLSYDTLLWWCSETGAGTWLQFRAACAHLRLPAVQAVRALQALGHIEIAWSARRWAAAPTTLTTIPRLPGRLLVCGARPSHLVEHLRQVADSGGYDVLVDDEPIAQQAPGPATILIDAAPADAADFAAAAAVRFQPAAHRAIATVLQPAVLDTVGEPATPDDRFPHCLIDPDTLQERWDLDTPEGADGLWAWQTWQRRAARYLRREGQWWYLPEAEHGPYLLAARPPGEEHCRYEPAHEVLVVHGRAPLPVLHARAAVLCSGRLPLRQHLAEDTAEDHYVNVDHDTARMIVTSLQGATT